MFNSNLLSIICTAVISAVIVYFIMKNQNKESTKDEFKSIHTFPSPIKEVIDNFLTETECNEIIELSKPRLNKSTVGFDTNGNYRSRQTMDADLGLEETNGLSKITTLAEKLTGYPRSNFEPFNIVNYQQNNFFKYHTDSCNPFNDEKYKDCLDQTHTSGGRHYTILVYLNSNYVGGETHFPEIKTTIKRPTGSIMLFENYQQNTIESNKQAIHAGTPVIGGEKWILNLWIRDKIFDPDVAITVDPDMDYYKPQHQEDPDQSEPDQSEPDQTDPDQTEPVDLDDQSDHQDQQEQINNTLSNNLPSKKPLHFDNIFDNNQQQPMPQSMQQPMPQQMQQGMPQPMQQGMPQSMQQRMPQQPNQMFQTVYNKI